MAKAHLAAGMDAIAKGVELKHSTLSPAKGLGSYFQLHPDGCSIRTKHPLRKYHTKGQPYQKEMFCYIDQLYRDMDGHWKHLWISYYRAARNAKYPIIFPTPERETGHPIDTYKEFGVYSLWMHVWMKDLAAQFNEAFIKAFWIITDIKVEDGQLTFTFHYTNRGSEFVPISFFDPNLIRFGGRI